jgi:hypothetical protein
VYGHPCYSASLISVKIFELINPVTHILLWWSTVLYYTESLLWISVPGTPSAHKNSSLHTALLWHIVAILTPLQYNTQQFNVETTTWWLSLSTLTRK